MPLNGFGALIKKSFHGDEYQSPQNVVDLILPYVEKSPYRKIWCPFDEEKSLFVATFQKIPGFSVVAGHKKEGKDFFDYNEPQGEIVVSNPPFSLRGKIFEKLYSWDLPFALVTNFNGIFDSHSRFDLFSANDVEILVPKGRMKFISAEKQEHSSPSFQSVYFCNHLLGKQIVFDDRIKF